MKLVFSYRYKITMPGLITYHLPGSFRKDGLPPAVRAVLTQAEKYLQVNGLTKV